MFDSLLPFFCWKELFFSCLWMRISHFTYRSFAGLFYVLQKFISSSKHAGKKVPRISDSSKEWKYMHVVQWIMLQWLWTVNLLPSTGRYLWDENFELLFHDFFFLLNCSAARDSSAVWCPHPGRQTGQTQRFRWDTEPGSTPFHDKWLARLHGVIGLKAGQCTGQGL